MNIFNKSEDAIFSNQAMLPGDFRSLFKRHRGTYQQSFPQHVCPRGQYRHLAETETETKVHDSNVFLLANYSVVVVIVISHVVFGNSENGRSWVQTRTASYQRRYKRGTRSWRPMLTCLVFSIRLCLTSLSSQTSL